MSSAWASQMLKAVGLLLAVAFVALTASSFWPGHAGAHGDFTILECSGVGRGGDLAGVRGLRFTVDQSFVALDLRMDARVGGMYTADAQLRRSTGFVGPVEASSAFSVALPGTPAIVPYPVVHIDFPSEIVVTSPETFTLMFNNVSDPDRLFFEAAGIGSFPCPGSEVTNENSVAVPTERTDSPGFKVLSDSPVPAVGGVSLDSDLQPLSLEATNPGSSSWAIAAGVVAAACLLAGGAAWLLRRRLFG